MKLRKELLELKKGFEIDYNNSKNILKKKYKQGIYEFNDFTIKHLVNIEKTQAEIALIEFILENYLKDELKDKQEVTK